MRDINLGGETVQSIVTQANALAERNKVEILSVYQSAEARNPALSPRVKVRHLVSVQQHPARLLDGPRNSADVTAGLDELDSVLGQRQWTTGYSSLTDLAVEQALGNWSGDVIVTTTPALLDLAVRFARPTAAVVHQEHRVSSAADARREHLAATAPLANLVTALNNSEATWVRQQLGTVAPRIEVVPHPIDPGFRPRSLLNAPIIMAAGPLVPDSQFADLIRAFSLISDTLPDWRLRIFGGGPRRAALASQCRRLRLFDRVELPGGTRDMASEWAKASIAVLTSRATGMPVRAIEAMAAGVPVVSYDSPSGPRELITHEEDGLLVPPRSVPGLASALHRLAESADLRVSLGQAARSTAGKFDAKFVAERWERLFEEAVTHHGSLASRSRIARRMEYLRTRLPDRPQHNRSTPSRAKSADQSVALTPSDAKKAALSWVAETAGRASRQWFVMPGRWGEAEATVVVPAPRRGEFLAHLVGEGMPTGLFLIAESEHGWPETSGPGREMIAELQRGHTAQIGVQVCPPEGIHRYGCKVRVEFWEAIKDTLVAPGPRPHTSWVALDEPTVDTTIDGVAVRSLPLMTVPTIWNCTLPVDAVYTWVDGSDPAWQRRRQQRLAKQGRGVSRIEVSGTSRYTSRDELRFSLRSLHLFAPWIRHIYLVTDRQTPSWLDTAHPDVTVVDHGEILADACRPTFNSHAIETGLHRIANLSEQFIYFNDDVFLGRPVAKERFFNLAGHAAVFFSEEPVGVPTADAKPHQLAALNNQRLLLGDFGRTITNTLQHTPHPLRRSLLAELEEKYTEEFRQTAAAPVRSPSDLAVASSLAQHYSLLKGEGFVGDLSSTLIPLNTPELGPTLERLLEERLSETFCLNDYIEYALPVHEVDQILAEILARYFPLPAPWELQQR